ncbi:PEP/pyruvate-binding domain-containing protein [Tessaracoccus caeni]|uniref:PEP/pyruvate-binding domain-containing protein n=1 Tax=Tessaracoccus caeni TaxID=3031239 RepID=UPI0023DA664A|nr:PEP/pyruvate-binding domain-containing protein [Tessaracoccus caeni]MDF1486754.1 PEP/pyruvate-binding domain-containing protein [Tessaracoccus caeni]
MTDAGADRLQKILTNLAAAAFGFGGAALTGFSLWAVLVGPLTGTLGWFVGWFGGRALGSALSRRGYAPPGRPVYRLRELPEAEATAGGKARALSRLIRAGYPVPDGVVLLPRAFVDDQLTAEAAEALHDHLRPFPEGQRFAVRSSAQGEDSEHASFAGAYESVLDVPADGLGTAIAAVRASGAAGRVAAYARSSGAETGELAVIVQAMVPAELAGVLFTVDPISGDLDSMLGSVVRGLGEALVSGEDTGEQFRLARPSGDLDGPDVLVPFAKSLHDAGHRVEATFDSVPQDIEWAVADGKVWLLQARPITTLNPWRASTAERNDSLAGNCLWSATNLSEANPIAQTPLTISLSRYQQANGGPSMALRGREMAGFIGGRPYANLSVQITGRRGKSGKADPREVYRKLSGWWGSLPDDVPIPLIPMTADDWTQAGIPLLGSLLRMGWTRLGLARFLRRNPAQCDALVAEIAASRTSAELRRLWDERLFAFSLDSFWAVIASGSEYPARLETELRAELGPEDASALMSNLAGHAGNLESLGPAEGLQQVRSGALSRAEYVARFGHRGVNETELAWARPSEDPGWLDRELARAAGVDIAASRRRQDVASSAVVARLRERDPKLARGVERRVRKAAKRAALREAARSEGVRTTGVLRAFALRAGELLGIGDDVFLLTVEELLDALAGDTRPNVSFDGRRATYQRYLDLPALPGLICGSFDPFAWAADPDRRGDLAGSCVSARTVVDGDPSAAIIGHPGAVGRVEGTVRVLTSFDDADQLRPGEVLVTPLTNIGWTPIFPIAAAIVTDLGAPLSHAAIVARELGIPAVVGCGDATSRLRTGDRVLVDGAAGTVSLLAEEDQGRTSPDS